VSWCIFARLMTRGGAWQATKRKHQYPVPELPMKERSQASLLLLFSVRIVGRVRKWISDNRGILPRKIMIRAHSNGDSERLIISSDILITNTDWRLNHAMENDRPLSNSVKITGPVRRSARKIDRHVNITKWPKWHGLVSWLGKILDI